MISPSPHPSPWQPVPFDSGRWRIQAAESAVTDHLGRRSLRLHNGTATLGDLAATDGGLEFDLAFTGERGFMGGVWRVQDAGNYEEFYLRPHQSGNPDATQYTPVWNGLSGWQLYHGGRYSVPLVHRFDEWTRVRILYAGGEAEIYVGDMAAPVLRVEELKRPLAAGTVGVSAGNFAAAHFSDFAYSTEATALQAPARLRRPAAAAPHGIIPFWWVSDAFRESALRGGGAPGRDELGARRWSRLETERDGLANLARVQGIVDGRNTVFVRRSIVSDGEQSKDLAFGWSDRVRVFLNGRPLFRGDDTCRSRDYRFLGSIGYYDALYLPLVRGENELVLAVSEDQGGWGVQAKLADLGGLTFID